jgi:hypothetical protein
VGCVWWRWGVCGGGGVCVGVCECVSVVLSIARMEKNKESY